MTTPFTGDATLTEYMRSLFQVSGSEFPIPGSGVRCPGFEWFTVPGKREPGTWNVKP